MNKITPEDILTVARQSKLALSEEEVGRFVSELSAIVGYAELLQEVDVSGVEPMTSPILGQTTPFREDVVEPGLTQEEALRGSVYVEAGHFRVPKTIEG
jgi:aspartyl-tRNA(Asn)/glutamyl-tRNA(Gln) amidotransferase subunit C